MSDAGTMYANAKALHELLQESRAENAELRKERDALDHLTDVLNATNDGLIAENAKLRELMRELYEDQCDECDEWKYRDRMRELGVEV